MSTRHGGGVPRGLDAPEPRAHGARFGRMFAANEEPVENDPVLLRMTSGQTGDNSKVAAGYTYLGQFIDHDITFDPTSQLDRDNDPYALRNFRTPGLDLDSLYGSGPSDSPYLYEWDEGVDRGIKLLVGDGGRDLPRNQQGIALIGDPRNDENLIISQLHLLFIHFHNKVVDHVRAERGLAGGSLLRRVQRMVRWHYQWIVVHEFLPLVVGQEMIDTVLALGPEERFYKWHDVPDIPIEFSVAAYRFGHSMVRDDYRLRHDVPKVPIVSHVGGRHLGGFRPLPRGLEIDWAFFFKLPGRGQPQPSRLIDPIVAGSLQRLPTALSAEGEGLPALNLRRARALRVPTGPAVAKAMRVGALTDRQLVARLPTTVTLAAGNEVSSTMPLWTYVLNEATILQKGERLGPVGGRIVAEVLLGLLAADRSSYLSRCPNWRPRLPSVRHGYFTVADIVRFVAK